jgi:trk system potassium uptake protein TrkA
MRVHFAGAGQCAEYVARRLIREGHDLCLMDRDEVRCHALEEILDAQVVVGDAMNLNDWRHAGLDRTELFVGCTDADEHNVLACLIANELAPGALKAIRLRTPEFSAWGQMLKRLGVRVDRVIHPESDVLERILRVLNIPGVDDIRNFADERVKVFSMNVEPDSVLAGKSLRSLRLEGVLSTARVSLIFRGTGVSVPDIDDVILPGDHVYVITTRELLEETLIAVGITRHERLREVFIVGGSELALELALALEAQRVPAKLFEQDPRRCEELAEKLTSTTIINANGTDQGILMRENIESVHAFISLIRNDDANLISSLLARRLGVDKVIPLLHRLDYLPLAQRLGINTVASPRVKAADALFEFFRGGGVLSVRTLGEEAAEAIELDVPEGSKYTGRKLSEIVLPPGTLIGAVVPPGMPAQLPQPDTVINAGDRVVFFAQEDAVHKLEVKVLNGSRR